jgi:hypothetical protein
VTSTPSFCPATHAHSSTPVPACGRMV